MKKEIKLLILLSIIVSFTACNKEKNVVEKQSSAKGLIKSYYQDGNSCDGSVLLVNDYMQTKYHRSSYNFSFQGDLADDKHYSNIDINGYSVEFLVNNYFYSSSSMDSSLSGNLSTYFGAYNHIDIDGSVFTDNFYIPSPVIVSFPKNPDFVFTKSSGIYMSLSPDINNSNPIIIILEYVPDNAVTGDILLTKTYKLSSQISKFTIPSEDLVGFPKGENLILYVGCGNGKIVSFDNHNIDLEGVNITYLPGIKLN